MLLIPELIFNAAHYISGHEKCGCIHGHTYFVRNIVVKYDSGFVDFGDIKACIIGWDHRFIVPHTDAPKWLENELPAKCRIRMVDGSATAETIVRAIHAELMNIRGVVSASLELYEGPRQGVRYPPGR